MSADERHALFISHASPQDNPFTLWLGAKLAALGFEVWADILRLRGGDDWQRKLEQALRQRARKVLLVANPVAVDKQGVRNELQIANDVAREIGDAEFIIPLKLAPFEAPFLIAQAQYIDFEKSWAEGLRELLEVLEPIPRSAEDQSSVWRALQQINGKAVIDTPEVLRSNWLAVERLPKELGLYAFKSGISERLAREVMQSCPWPLVEHGDRSFLSCASFDDLQAHFGANLPVSLVAKCAAMAFLDKGWEKQSIDIRTARNTFADLVHQAITRAFRKRGLSEYVLANGHQAWWGDVGTVPTNKVGFRWKDASGLRQIQGKSDKRHMHWHYGISVSFRAMPVRHVQIRGRLIFTEDGRKPFDDPKRMHRLRRSFAKSWRNARWRDMLMAFLAWLSSGGTTLSIPLGSQAALLLRVPPLAWTAPISIPLAAENAEPDEDDPSDDDEADAEDDDAS